MFEHRGVALSSIRSHSIPMTKTETQSADELISYMSNPTEEEKAMVRKAYDFAKHAHRDHKRMSGEPYFNHLYATAKALAEIDMGARTISAGLLHDSIEDVGVTPEQIREEFGPEVLFLVEGVTKLGELKYRGAGRHIESLRRLFVATSQDIRVLLIKLMDRRHNMHTLEHVKPEKRLRIATETLSIYAPIADRLGMGRLKSELEDLSFKYVYPKEYDRIEQIMSESKLANEPKLEKVRNSLKRALGEHGVKNFRTESRVKGLYSLYRKLDRKGGDLDKIYDLQAIRVILGNVEDCYRALGVAHTLWHPLPGKIKDYIAFEKPNGYRSIHSTVMTPEAGPVELQFRTEEMHREAQYGIASHLAYKEEGSSPDRGQQKRERLWYRHLIPSLFNTNSQGRSEQRKAPKWISELAEAHTAETLTERDTFMQEIQDDFFSHRIFVFTPKGDVIDLPIDSTPIDFAYAVHSEIGDRTARAKVNGKIAPLNAQLKNGDIVEIETKKNAHPTKKWCEYVRTTMARKHIHQALLRQQREGKH